MMVLMLLLLFSSLLVTVCSDSCTQYNYDSDLESSVVINNYNQLNCAIQALIPVISINDSFSFSGQIIFPLDANVTVQGAPVLPSTNIVLTSSLNNRLFNVSNGRFVRFQDLTFIGNQNTNELELGGLIYSEDSALELSSVSFALGASMCGSSVYSLNSSIVTRNSRFTNSTSTSSSCGGAIYASESSLSFYSVSFLYNVSPLGAALNGIFSQILIHGGIFSSNKATTSNGGSISLSSSSLTIQDSLFSKNTAGVNGGSLYLSNNLNVSIENTNFTSDIADSSGGSIYSLECPRFYLKDVILSSSKALNGNGGGIAFYNEVISTEEILIESSSFFSNQGSSAGGIYCSGLDNFYVTSSNFERNSAINSGGAVQIADQCDMIVTNSSFSLNSVLESDTPISIGGTITCQYANFTLSNSIVSSSFAIQGSVLYSFVCNVQILSSTIQDSIGNDGSIYCAAETALLVSRSLFSNNTGTTTSSGIICLNGISCNIQSSSFLNNTAAQLGVIQISKSNTGNIYNSYFYGNHADGVSGAVYFNEVKKGTLISSVFLANSATTYGGSVAVLASSVIVNSTTFSNSKANSGGGLYIFELSDVSLSNCSFSSNTAYDSGGAIYVGDQSVLTGNVVNIVKSSGPYGAAVYMSYRSKAIFYLLTASSNIAGYSGEFSFSSGLSCIFFFFFLFFQVECLESLIIRFYQFMIVISTAMKHILEEQSQPNTSVMFIFIILISMVIKVIQSLLLLSSFPSICLMILANSYGGIAYILVFSSLLVSDCVFTSNIGFYGGGAFLVETSSLNVTSSTFDYHQGYSGGVVYAIDGIAVISNSRFYQNGGTTYQGGAIYLSAMSVLDTFNCNFTSNQVNLRLSCRCLMGLL
jgi:predicted outer membrane repeat protein